MLRGVVYRLIEFLVSMGHSSIWKRICASSVWNTLTVGVHLSSTPSISGPGSATASCNSAPASASCNSAPGRLWSWGVIDWLYYKRHENSFITQSIRWHSCQRSLNGITVDDGVLFHLICSILVSKCSVRANSENEYPHFIFLDINNEVIVSLKLLVDIFTHRLTPNAYTLHWLYGCSVLCICGQLFNFYQANLYADMLSYML